MLYFSIELKIIFSQSLKKLIIGHPINNHELALVYEISGIIPFKYFF